jgi:hypothetical protein
MDKKNMKARPAAHQPQSQPNAGVKRPALEVSEKSQHTTASTVARKKVVDASELPTLQWVLRLASQHSQSQTGATEENSPACHSESIELARPTRSSSERPPRTYSGSHRGTLTNKGKRTRQLKALRSGLPGEPAAIQILARLASQGHDQTLQKAAITGLSKHDTPDAMLGIARRLLNTWGVGAIRHCIGACRKTPKKGGLLLLSSTLFYDNRFIAEKLEGIGRALAELGDEFSLKQLRALDDISELYRCPSHVNTWRTTLKRVANADVREGVVFGSQFEGPWGWQGRVVPEYKPGTVAVAVKYVESRLPGLGRVFEESLDRTADSIGRE